MRARTVAQLLNNVNGNQRRRLKEQKGDDPIQPANRLLLLHVVVLLEGKVLGAVCLVFNGNVGTGVQRAIP